MAVTPNGLADAVVGDRFIMPEERQMSVASVLDIIEGKVRTCRERCGIVGGAILHLKLLPSGPGTRSLLRPEAVLQPAAGAARARGRRGDARLLDERRTR